jgi:hypothetical protein
MKFQPELKKVFDESVREVIEEIPAFSIPFKRQGLDLKDCVDNEMDFYLGALIATILERYMLNASIKGFTKQQIYATSPLAALNIFNMIPTLKEEIKLNIGL